MAKKLIHPQYFIVNIICTTCKNEFISGSTKEKEIKVDTCSLCHPFYTNNQQFIDKVGSRIEKFKNKFNKKNEISKLTQNKVKKSKELNKKTKNKIII